jgi:phosphoribosylformylglycinamidine (FGAM) synthase-like enzyme
MQVQWDYLLGLHAQRRYVSASALGEGGIFLRLFEAAFGSGLGARVDLNGIPAARRDGLLFGEFIGTCLIEVPPEFAIPANGSGIPHQFIGHVTSDSRLELADGETVIWDAPVSRLAETWGKTFREVVK